MRPAVSQLYASVPPCIGDTPDTECHCTTFFHPLDGCWLTSFATTFHYPVIILVECAMTPRVEASTWWEERLMSSVECSASFDESWLCTTTDEWHYCRFMCGYSMCILQSRSHYVRGQLTYTTIVIPFFKLISSSRILMIERISEEMGEW